MLVNLSELLSEAEKHSRAVGAFNVPNLESLRGVIAAAEKANYPVILQHAEVHEHLIQIEEIGPIMLEFAKKAKVPVAVHLDHGATFDMCMKAIRLGFTSIMYDASLKPFQQNKVETKEIVKIAHAVNVSVEAELGQMINSEIGSGEGRATNLENTNPADLFTNPQQAKEFSEETGVDCLAISFGTVHGLYTAKPNLDFERIQKIKELVKKPLVMHGGSGVSASDYEKAIQCGIRKINYYTYMNQAGATGVKKQVEKNEPLFFDELSLVAQKSMEENVLQAIQLFSGKNIQ